MIRWTEKIGTILAELRIAKCQELVVPVTNLYAIEECSINSSEQLIVALLVGTRINPPL